MVCVQESEKDTPYEDTQDEHEGDDPLYNDRPNRSIIGEFVVCLL